jgi:pilus assembly protein CpaF
MARDIEFADDAPSFANSQQFQDIKNAAHEHLLTRIEELGSEFGRWSRNAINQFVDLEMDSFVRLRRIPINESEVRAIADALTKELAGFGPIEDLLNDPAVEDILINGYNDVYVSRHGIMTKIQVRFADNAHLLRIVRRILAPIGRRLDESNPMVDARLPNGGRVNVVIEPLSIDGPIVSIRKFRKDPLRPDDLLANGTYNAEIGALLDAAVSARCNVLVAGGTSSGKTTLANALLAELAPRDERVILIEDTRELQCAAPNLVAMRTKDGVASLTDLVRSSLRLRPDRIPIGEVRGREALDLLKAWGTGHPGGIGTIHASTAIRALRRLEQLVQEAVVMVSRALIAETIDLIAVLAGRGIQRRLAGIWHVGELGPAGDYIVTPLGLDSLGTLTVIQGDKV